MVSSDTPFPGLMAAKLAARSRPPEQAEEGPAFDRQSLSDHRTHLRNRDNGVSSLHGAKAALRHAITELLFFASIGDLVRVQRVCRDFNIQPSEATDYDHRTPLHLASSEGCYSVVEWLLTEAKVPPNPIDRFSRTPLEDAARGDYGEVVMLLQQHGAQVYMEKDDKLVRLEDSSLSMFVQRYSQMCADEEGAGAHEDVELQPEWEIDRRELQLLEVVGKGEFGTVHLGKWLGSTVAIKVLKASDAVALGDFRTECHVLQKIHHPHAVQFLGACTRDQPYMIVTEFIPGGSLSDFFKSLDIEPDKHPSLRRSVSIALDCAKGMFYMHARRKHIIIHRDLKPANIMLGGLPADIWDRGLAQRYGTAKIADFGLSKSLALRNAPTAHSHRKLDGNLEECIEGNWATELYQLTGETGSYRYMAPEVYRHEPYNSAVDVYAWAMVCYELFEGKIPFQGEKPIQAARRAAMEHARPVFGAQNRWGRKLPTELKQLVQACWAPAAKDRPGFSDCVIQLEAVLAKLPADKDRKGKKGCVVM